jgi:N-methylhydantoinase B/oxoprolinase/acetone carboxylase alpha subunit
VENPQALHLNYNDENPGYIVNPKFPEDFDRSFKAVKDCKEKAYEDHNTRVDACSREKKVLAPLVNQYGEYLVKAYHKPGKTYTKKEEREIWEEIDIKIKYARYPYL